jgi:hypothetical protein
MEDLKSLIKKEGLSSGLLLGLALLILGIIAYYLLISADAAVWLIVVVPVVFTMLIPIGIAIYFTIDVRKKVGGFWNFRQATTGIFIMFLVAFSIQYAGRDLLFAKLIEPDMVVKMQDAVVKSTAAMLEKSGAEQSKIDEKIDEIQSQFDSQKNQGIGKTIQGLAVSIIFVFIVALIFGAIFKKEKLLSPYEVAENAIDPTE